ncbi:MAG: hypothetical protein D6754_09485 [Alphaproteobacteria bacterium]|nr:MAG: hypothetical protein D6754_09485 [Alphaproteobacteria bacterium]
MRLCIGFMPLEEEIEMFTSARIGIAAATIALIALPQLAPAQTMSAEEILRRIQLQREMVARREKEAPRTRTLSFAPQSTPSESTSDAAAVVSETPPDTAENTAPALAAPETTDTSSGVALASDVAPEKTEAPRLVEAKAVENIPVYKAEHAVDLVVYFEFDSAILRADAKEQLDALCTALQADATGVYRVIGHTDAAGSDAYNLTLSKARAKSVVRYLVDSCGIAAERLEPLGLGELRLRDSAHPRAAVNRRVEIQVAS